MKLEARTRLAATGISAAAKAYPDVEEALKRVKLPVTTREFEPKTKAHWVKTTNLITELYKLGFRAKRDKTSKEHAYIYTKGVQRVWVTYHEHKGFAFKVLG